MADGHFSEIQLTTIALLYHKRGWKQSKIARRYGVSSMTVSRALKRAEELGIVEVRVNLPFEHVDDLERALIDQYGLNDALVVRSVHHQPLLPFLGRAGGFHLGLNMTSGMTVGIAGGSIMASVIQGLPSHPWDETNVVQLIGGLGPVGEENPFNVAQNACEKLGAAGTYFYAPAIAESSELRDQLMNSQQAMDEVTRLWNDCDVALISLGLAEPNYFRTHGLISDDDLAEIRNAGAVGDVLGRFYDENGNIVDISLHRRVVAIPLETLRKIPNVIVVGGGPERIPSLRGGLLTGLVRSLITDETSARQLLDGISERRWGTERIRSAR